jgi:protease II
MASSMRFSRTFSWLLAVVFAACGAPVLGASAPAQKVAAPPPTRTDNVRETLHGVEIVDPYRWLEDQQSPDTRAWIDAQNRYTQSLLGQRPSLAAIRTRLSSLMRSDRMSVPRVRGGQYFFTLQRADQDLAVICRRASPTAEAQPLVDPLPMSRDHTTSVGLMDVSHDGQRMAYSIRRGGTDEVEVRVRDVAGGRDLPDTLAYGLYGSVSLTRDGDGMFYARRSRETGGRILFHRMGTPAASDVEVFGKGYGKDIWVGASISEDGRHVLYSADHGWGRSEVFVGGIAADSDRSRRHRHRRPLQLHLGGRSPVGPHRLERAQVPADGRRPGTTRARQVARDRARGQGRAPGRHRDRRPDLRHVPARRGD